MSGDEPGSEPEDTMPFTHRPYGSGEQENPFTSPSGPASQPSGPGYVVPGPGEPPTTSPPYGPPMTGQPMPGQPMPGQPPWQQAWAPAYGVGYPGVATHKGATQSLVLGIIAAVSVVLTPFCCITIPGLICAPFAWVIGAKARREIDAQPGVYGNRGAAQAGFVLGIICSALGVLVLALFIGFAVLIGSGWSLV